MGIGTCGASIARDNHEAGPLGTAALHAVSADGSRVFFEAVPVGREKIEKCNSRASKHLYVRVNGVETLDLGAYRFAAANADGSEVLLEKPGGENPGLYLYQGKTVKPLASTGSIAGTTFIVSDDLKAIYFTSGAASETDIYRYDVVSETLGLVVQSDDAAAYNEIVSEPGRALLLLRFAWCRGPAGWRDGPRRRPRRTPETVVVASGGTDRTGVSL